MPDKVDTTSKKGSFVSNMVAELKKVIWPTAGQTVKGTGTVIIFVLIITCILVALNFAFQKINETYWEQFNPNKPTTSQTSEEVTTTSGETSETEATSNEEESTSVEEATSEEDSSVVEENAEQGE